MLFAFPSGAVGNAVSKATNELIIPNYKQTWGNVRKLADAPEAVRHLSFKIQGFRARREDGTLSGPDHGAGRDTTRTGTAPTGAGA